MRRAGHGEISRPIEFLLHIGFRENVHNFTFELVDDRLRRSLGRDEAEPDREIVEIFQVGCGGEGRHVGVGLLAPVELGERTHLAALDQRTDRDGRAVDHVDTAGEQALHRLGRALERHIDDIDAGRLVEQHAHELRGDGAGAVIDLPGAALARAISSFTVFGPFAAGTRGATSISRWS